MDTLKERPQFLEELRLSASRHGLGSRVRRSNFRAYGMGFGVKGNGSFFF